MDDPCSKRCRNCKNILPVSDFTHDRSEPDGWSPRCKPCTRQYFRRYRSDKQEHIASMLRRHGLARKYRLTPAHWAAMLADQEGKCAICLHDFDSAIPACNAMVDHDHTTGQVRSLLCRRCNAMIGMAREEIGVLQAAIVYLKLWSSI